MTAKVVKITPRGVESFDRLEPAAQEVVREAFGRMQTTGLSGSVRMRDIDGKGTYAVRAGSKRLLVIEEPEALMVLDIVSAPTVGGPSRLDGKKAS